MDALLPNTNNIKINMITNGTTTTDNDPDPSCNGDQDQDQKMNNGNQSLPLSEDYCENELEIDGKLMLTDSDDNGNLSSDSDHIDSKNKDDNGNNSMNVNSDSDDIESSHNNKGRKLKQKKLNIIDSDSSIDEVDNKNDNVILSNKINSDDDDEDQDKTLPIINENANNNDVRERINKLNESKSSADNLSENSESDSSSSSIIKNRKKKKFTKRKVRRASDQLPTVDNDSEHDGITNNLNTLCDNDSTSDENDSEDSDQSSRSTNKSVSNSIGSEEIDKKRPEIRMSAKQAMDQMKLIKSESQRMARERQISVPYHQPKQYTLKEFLTRRNAKKTESEMPIVNNKHLKAAAAIKMSKIELEKYGKLLEERAKDAEEFFKSDDDEKPENNNNDDEDDDDDDDDKDYNFKEDDGVNEVKEVIDDVVDKDDDKDEVDKNKVEDTEILTNSNNPNDVLKNTSEFTSTDEIIELMECNNNNNDDYENDTKQNDIISMDIALSQINEENSDVIITNFMDIDKNLQKVDNDKLEEISVQQNNEKELINTNENHTCKELISTVVNEIPTIDDILNEKELNKNTIENDLPSSIKEANPPSIKEIIQSMANKKIPKLSGLPNTFIDLESGEILPKTNSGVDKLFDQYLKHTTKLSTVSDELLPSATSDTQKQHNGLSEVNCKTKLVFIDSTDPSNRRNPKVLQPGKSIQKLKDELRKKMSIQRNEAYLQKIKAIQKLKKESNSESDENSDNEKCDKKINDELEEDCTGKQVKNDGACKLLDDKDITKKDDETETMEKDIDEEEDEDDNDDEDEVYIDYDDDENITENKQNDSECSNDSDSSATDTPNDKSDGNKLKRIIINLDDSDSDNDSEICKLTDFGLDTNGRNNIESNGPMTTKKPTISESTELFSCASFDDADRLENDLYEPASNCEIGESQLMDLCSGTFETQLPSTSKPHEDIDMVNDVAKEIEYVNKNTAKKILDSSSEGEDDDENDVIKEKKHKKNKIYLSDDDDADDVQSGNTKLNDNNDEENDKESDEDDDGGNDDDNKEEDEDDDDGDDEKETNKEKETEQGDDYLIDYDSEENEIEVPKSVGNEKKSKRLRVSEFMENEAELSESEWGSEDEDEQNLDKLDVELGDEDEFDKDQLASELGRIHMRRMLDQDAREVKLIKDILLEDEEKDGIGRERQFKWKNIDNSMNVDDLNGGGDGNDGGLLGGEPGDDENEEQWRRMRYEREQLLAKDKDEDLNNIKLTNTTVETVTGNKIKKISIIKSSHNTPQSSPSIENHFLISSEKDVQRKSVRGSFLTRDQETLTKLAYLTKNVGGGDAADGPIAQLTVAVNKTKNFSFSIRAIDKDGKNEETIKRKNDSVTEEYTMMSSATMNPQKKPKITIHRKNIYSKKSLFDQIN